jgi:hypothetical protein
MSTGNGNEDLHEMLSFVQKPLGGKLCCGVTSRGRFNAPFDS